MKTEQKKFLVEISKHALTLLNERELREKLKTGGFRIYIEETDSWIHASEIRLMPSERREWYYFQSGRSYGVYNELELIRLVQSKKIHPSQPVWKPGMKSWVEFCKTNEFNSNSLQKILNHHPFLIETIFSKRKSKRISFQADFILQEKEKVWKAKSFEIGTGGVGLQIHGSGLSLGQSVDLHIISNSQLHRFAVRAEVVSHLRHVNGKMPDRFGLKFLEIQLEDRHKIQKLISVGHGK